MIDDNNVTIAGHPADYMQGFDVGKTLAGHGLAVDSGDGEDLDALFSRIQACLVADGPVALINKRLMAAGVPGIEGSTKGHDVIPVPMAIDYLTAKKHTVAVEILQHTTGNSNKTLYLGSTQEKSKNRDEFGKIICGILQGMENPESKALVVDSDLEGSCGLHHIRKAFPDLYVHGGIMERNNFSVAAGFGATPGRQGIFGTFAAFQEMLISEITMARLNRANVLAHFSHSGIDDMADNTCHFGINNFFADNGLAENDTTRLYFPADALQMRAIIETVYHNPGLKFIFSTRSATPLINDDAGALLYRDGYTFLPDKDEIVRKGTAGYIVSYGEMLYRCLDVVEKLKAEGIDTGLINKPTLNVVDPQMLAKVGNSPFVLVVETQNTKTGLGSRYGTWLLENGYTPKYGAMGTTKEGEGGLWEQIPYQGMGSEQIIAKLKALMAHCQ
jgi:transketolase C-terminal domain/subunit